MRVIIKETGYFEEDGNSFLGKKVIAKPMIGVRGNVIGVFVMGSELKRVSSETAFSADFPYFFDLSWVEVIQPTMVNCSDSNVGKGWGGFYEQKPIKKSKFR